jgi:2-polyprenyl-3-methyl-5-hydroxy-6-metoxy-1,4-benzoquinol methylase
MDTPAGLFVIGGSRMAETSMERFLAAAQTHRLWSTPARLRTYGEYLYRDIPLKGASLLDIGGGSGVFSLYAAASGASRVVCLEPEAAGSLKGKREKFLEVAHACGITGVEMRPDTLQDFDAGGERFDVVLLHASINHLDEDACIRIRRDPAAREVYRRLFEMIAGLIVPGGHLLMTDCTPNNLWPALHLKNPMAPWIEWHKHQPPEVWRDLGQEVGLRPYSLRWTAPSMLGGFGRVLMGNRLGAYITIGAFRLHMLKPQPVVE